MPKLLVISNCEGCPHFIHYDPDRDPNPDVGWAWETKACTATDRWIKGPGESEVSRPDGFPEWCPLDNPLCS